MDGYTEGKIEKFGLKFVDVIKNFSPIKKQSIIECRVDNQKSEESNLTLLLGEIEKVHESREAVSFSDTVVEQSNECEEESLIFDDGFDALIEQVNTSPLLKRQKMVEPPKETEGDATSNRPTEVICESSAKTYLLLKKKATKLPPWLRTEN